MWLDCYVDISHEMLADISHKMLVDISDEMSALIYLKKKKEMNVVCCNSTWCFKN